MLMGGGFAAVGEAQVALHKQQVKCAFNKQERERHPGYDTANYTDEVFKPHRSLVRAPCAQSAIKCIVKRGLVRVFFRASIFAFHDTHDPNHTP